MFDYPIGAEAELRILEESHAHALSSLTNANWASLRQWLPGVDRMRTVDQTLEFIRVGLNQYANNDGFQCGIWSKGQLAGTIGYHFFDWNNRRTSLVYWLGAKHRGKGLMTSAVRALTHYAFIEVALHRVEIRCATQNERSNAVPKRLGFTYEGISRETEWLYNRYVDHNVYSMLRHEWLNKQRFKKGE